MKTKWIYIGLIILAAVSMLYTQARGQKNVITIRGTSFEMNGEPFEYTGVSFFNAIFNKEFNKSSQVRKEWMQKFLNTGINVLRVWCQWDNIRGFIDGGEGNTIYNNDGSVKPEYLDRIQAIVSDADEKEMVILLVLFSRESWNENLRLSDEASEKAISNLTRELQPYRNVIFQIWNEFDYRTVDYLKFVKSVDKERLVTNSPGYAGELGSIRENGALDFLSPHTTRRTDRHWEIAYKEISYLLEKYKKPVVDDEPARKGTPKFGGPQSENFPIDHILRIYNVWKAGGYVNYHHDMFQTGYGTDAVPSNGIPVPGFDAYHDEVFDFLKKKQRILKNIR
jgi:hypothetical protein